MENWMNGMDDDEDVIGPGIIADKKQACSILGLTAYALDQLLARGLPVKRRGDKRTPWQFEIGTVARWMMEDAVRADNDDSESARYREAKRAKMQAEYERLKFDNDAKRRELITIDEAAAAHREQADIVRRHVGAVPAAVVAALAGLKPEDRRDTSFVETLIADKMNAAMAAICADNGGDHAEAA